MNILKHKSLLIVVLLALVLRFWGLADNPPSLNWDEVSHGYNAFSILTSGRDEWGKLLPTIFRAYGDYKLPVYIYLTVVSEAIFGLTPFAVRFVGAVAGVFTVICSYLLIIELGRVGSLGRNVKKIALLTAFLVAVEPWSLFLSRGAFEANLALALIVSGVYFFLLGLRKTRGFLISAILLGLSVWTYNTARVFVPMLVVWLVIVFIDEIRGIWEKESNSRRIVSASLLILGLFFLPMFWQMINSVGSARYEKVEILDEGAISQIVEARNTSGLNPTLNRVVNNKATYFTKVFGINYVSHFTPRFLFSKGGDQYQFSVQGHGLVYWVNVVFLILGLVYLIKVRTKASAVIFGWLLLAPIASSLTREAPHVLRSIVMIPMPMILTSVGLFWIIRKASDKFKSTSNVGKVIIAIYVSLVLVSLGVYLQKYFGEYRTNYSWSWQYGYEQVVDYAQENYDKYDKIIVTKKYGEPHEFFLFYQEFDPAEYRDDSSLIRYEQSDWFWTDRFDKYNFVNDWQIAGDGTNDYEFFLESTERIDCEIIKCLLITSPRNVPSGWKLIKSVDFLDGDTAFEIYKN